MGVEGLSSVFIFPILIFPRYSVANASTVGVIALQGPHQGAQKSTRTGTSEFSTSLSKEPSVKFSVLSPAIRDCPFLLNTYDARSAYRDASSTYSFWYSAAETRHEKSLAIPRRMRSVHVSPLSRAC